MRSRDCHRIKTTSVHIPCLCWPEAFEYFVVQPPSRHCTAQPCFFSRKFASTLSVCFYLCSSFKEHCRCLSFFHFYDDFHFHLPHCRDYWVLLALWTGCLLWSFPHDMWSRGADAICGVSLKEEYWPSEGDTAPPPHIGVPHRQKTWCQPWLRNWTAGDPADDLKAPLHRIHRTGYGVLAVGSAAHISIISAGGKGGKCSPFHRIIRSEKNL